MAGPGLTTSGGFYRLGLSPSGKPLPTVLQKQSLKAALDKPFGEADQLVMAGSSSVCSVENHWEP